MHMFTQIISPHHHQHICIYEFINNSSLHDIYAITNTFTIQLTFMCSPITTQSTNIYAFTNINVFKIHQDSLEEFSSQIKIHKVFSNQFKAIGKLIKPLKTFIFMPRVNSKPNYVKRTQNAKQKNWNWGNSPPKLSSSPWRAENPLCHHVARRGGQNMPPVTQCSP